jgi:hypothetical protein
MLIEEKNNRAKNLLEVPKMKNSREEIIKEIM